MTSSKRIPQPEEIKASAQRIWLAGLGALTMAEEEGSKLFRNLVDRGAAFEARGKEHAEDIRERVEEQVDETVDEARSKAKEFRDTVRERVTETAGRVKSEVGGMLGGVERQVDRAVSSAFERAGVPTREEISVLSTRIQELTRLVEQLKKDTAKS